MESEINAKLAHLSAGQIETLISRYYAGESIASLLREYQIDCRPSELFRLFPATVLPERLCPYCATPMVGERPSRSSIAYLLARQAIHCPACGHRDGVRCPCPPCQAKRATEHARRQEQRAQALADYCRRSHTPAPPSLTVNDFSIRFAVALLALVRAGTYVDMDEESEPSPADFLVIEALEHSTVPFAPGAELGAELMTELLEAGLIGLSELSDEDAFTFDGETVSGYDPLKVRWAITVENAQRLIEEIERRAADHAAWPGSWLEGAKALWFEIALAESTEFYRRMARARDLPESDARSTEAMLKNLLNDYAVSQCNRIIHSGARQAADFLARTKCPPIQAANFMVGACQRWADRARAENWEVKPFTRHFALPRSSLSFVLFDVFLRIGEAGFNRTPGSDLGL